MWYPCSPFLGVLKPASAAEHELLPARRRGAVRWKDYAAVLVGFLKPWASATHVGSYEKWFSKQKRLLKHPLLFLNTLFGWNLWEYTGPRNWNRVWGISCLLRNRIGIRHKSCMVIGCNRLFVWVVVGFWRVLSEWLNPAGSILSLCDNRPLISPLVCK